jgi:hypothetical protein
MSGWMFNRFVPSCCNVAVAIHGYVCTVYQRILQVGVMANQTPKSRLRALRCCLDGVKKCGEPKKSTAKLQRSVK